MVRVSIHLIYDNYQGAYRINGDCCKVTMLGMVLAEFVKKRPLLIVRIHWFQINEYMKKKLIPNKAIHQEMFNVDLWSNQFLTKSRLFQL